MMTDRVEDDVRAAVIEAIVSGPVKEAIPEVKETNSEREQPSAPPSKTKLKPVYDLTNALKEVAAVKEEQVGRPTVSDDERKACGVGMDKKLLHEMMGHLGR